MIRHIAFLAVLSLSGCYSTTEISYFPDQRGPLYCRLGEAAALTAPNSDAFEVISLNDVKDVFAIVNTTTNDVVILANKLNVMQATANPTYNENLGGNDIAAIKVLLTVGIQSDPKLLAAAKEEILKRYPTAVFHESTARDIFVDIYSIWLGSEYVRAPCDGVALDNIPFEVTLPKNDAERFVNADKDSLQFAGRVLYRDVKSGWRFHRSFSVYRRDISITR